MDDSEALEGENLPAYVSEDEDKYNFDDDDDDDDDNNEENIAQKAGLNDREPEKPKAEKKRTGSVMKTEVILQKLQGSRGLPSLVQIADKFKFKGKHQEIEDLTALKKCLHHWMCNELFPSYDADSCMKELEKLGKKRMVRNTMRTLRAEAKKRYMCNESLDVNLLSEEELMSTDFHDDVIHEFMKTF